MASSSMPAEEAGEENGPNWLELPRGVTTNILQRLRVEEIVMSVSQVCFLWWDICNDPLLWRFIDMTNPGPAYSNSQLVNICRSAVKISCCVLEQINIQWFATDDLLKFIADRAHRLRRMRLRRSVSISDEGMIEVAKKLRLLEYLEISFTNVSKDSLEAIGRGCPRLQVLRYETNVYFGSYDGDAFAIAKTMPRLRILHIAGNRISNKGLLAILDGCPLLEYLNLEKCFQLNVRGSLEKRCHEQIKYLRVPPPFVFSDDSDDDSFNSGFDCEDFGLDNLFV